MAVDGNCLGEGRNKKDRVCGLFKDHPPLHFVTLPAAADPPEMDPVTEH